MFKAFYSDGYVYTGFQKVETEHARLVTAEGRGSALRDERRHRPAGYHVDRWRDRHEPRGCCRGTDVSVSSISVYKSLDLFFLFKNIKTLHSSDFWMKISSVWISVI